MTPFEQKGADPARPAPGPGPVWDRFIIYRCAADAVTSKISFIIVTIWAISWKSRIPEVGRWDPIPGPPGSPPGEAAGGKKVPKR